MRWEYGRSNDNGTESEVIVIERTDRKEVERMDRREVREEYEGVVCETG